MILSDAAEKLTELAHRLKFPVTNTLMGLGGYPATDRQFVGMLGMHGTFEGQYGHALRRRDPCRRRPLR